MSALLLLPRELRNKVYRQSLADSPSFEVIYGSNLPQNLQLVRQVYGAGIAGFDDHPIALTCRQLQAEYAEEAVLVGPVFCALIFCNQADIQNAAQLPSSATHVRLYINPETAFEQGKIESYKEVKARLSGLTYWECVDNWNISKMQQEVRAQKLFEAVLAFMKESVIKVTTCPSLEVLEVCIDAPHNRSGEEDAALEKAAFWLRDTFNSVLACTCPRLNPIHLVVNRCNSTALIKFVNFGPFVKEMEIPALLEERQKHQLSINDIKARMAQNKAMAVLRAEAIAKTHTGPEIKTATE